MIFAQEAQISLLIFLEYIVKFVPFSRIPITNEFGMNYAKYKKTEENFTYSKIIEFN